MQQRMRSLLVLLSMGCAAVAAAGSHAGRQSGGGFVISGRVEDPHKLRPEEAVLTVGSNEGGYSFSSRPVHVRPDGSFATPRLNPATYVLQLVRTPHSPTQPATLVGLTITRVTNANVSGVSVTTRRDTSLTGKFRMVSDNPAARWPPHIVVNAQLAVEGEPYLGAEVAEGAPGGKFILRNAFGPRVLRCGYQLDRGNWWWPSNVLLDGRDITNVPTDFSEHPAGKLEVVFTQHPSGIIGTVVRSDGQPAVGAWVLVAAADRRLWQTWATTSHAEKTSAKGTFQITTLPGRYLARAFAPHAFSSRRVALEHLANVGSDGLALTVGEREQRRVTLTVAEP